MELKMEEKSNICAKILRVYEDEYAKRAKLQEKLGVFGIDDLSEAEARKFKLERICERLNSHGSGKHGNSISCKKCGGNQVYKGDLERKLKFDCGEIELKRAYYVCPKCKSSSFPLDEELNLSPEMEQGQLREKISILSTLISYHQVPEVSRILLGSEIHSASARRSLLKEAELVELECPSKELKPDEESTLYVEVDGFMCPTREARKNTQDQGYREAKACQAFLNKDCVRESKNRVRILDQLLEVEICDAKRFHAIFKDIFKRANPDKAKEVVFIADGAKWIWNLCESVSPQAIQILDYAHAKQHLHNCAKIIYGEHHKELNFLVKEKVGWLLEDKVEQVIEWLKMYENESEEIKCEIGYFQRNKKRMLYQTFKNAGLTIGSGAIESAGKRLAQGRIKGAGMRWNVKDLNPVLMLRAALFDGRLKNHWGKQRANEAEYFQRLAA